MIEAFILSLPFTAFALVRLATGDLLISYFTVCLLIFYFFMRKNNLIIFFPKEMRILLLFILYVLSVILWQYHTGILANKSVSQFVVLCAYFIFYLLLVNVFILQKEEGFFRNIGLFVFVSVVVSMLSYLQMVFTQNVPIFSWFRNAENAFSVVKKVSAIDTHVLWRGAHRITGYAPEPSMWAAFLAVPLSILFPRLFFYFRKKDLLFIIIITVSFFFSYGRTGWLSFFCALLVIPLFYLKKSKKVIFAFFVGFVILAILGGALLYNTSNDYSKMERVLGMTTAWKMFVSNPIFGVGWGGYSANRAAFSSITIGDYVGSLAYSFYFRLLGETGLIGIFFWLWFFRTMLIKIFNQYDIYRDNTKFKIVLMGLGLSLFSIIFSLVNIEGFNFMYIWFIFALISSFPYIFKIKPIENGN